MKQNIIDNLKITIEPSFNFKFDEMKEGVLMHINRAYTYDVIPEELINGILFQGIHEVPKGTTIQIETLIPMQIYFFFHITANGGYDEIFKLLKDWKLCETFPQYDIHNGDHGLRMIMYTIKADKGIYVIPPIVKNKACFNMVFQEIKN